MTMPEYRPSRPAPLPGHHRALSEPKFFAKDEVPDIPRIAVKQPKDLPKLRSPAPRLPSINESALEPFRETFLRNSQGSQLSSPSDTESPTSDTKDSRLSITTVATSLYSQDDDGIMPKESMELPLHFHPGSDGRRSEDTIVCGLPCTDPHRAQELQYTLDVLTGECPRRLDEEAIAIQAKIMGKKLGANSGAKKPAAQQVKPAAQSPVAQPVKPSGLAGMFAGAKERKKMERQLLKRFEGKKPTTQKPKRKIL